MTKTHPENQDKSRTAHDLPDAFGNATCEAVFLFDNRVEEVQASQSIKEDVKKSVPAENVIEEVDSVLQGQEISFDVEKDYV
jgi:hypothetical protein